MKPIAFDEEELWHLLSELYLDQEHDDSWLQYIASRISAMPIDVPTLERILFEQVHPALFTNVLSVAGEWAGFDKAWLAAEIRASLSCGPETAAARSEGLFARIATRNQKNRLTANLREAREMVLPSWHRLLAHIRGLRSACEQTG